MAYPLSNAILVAIGVLPADHLVLYTVIFIIIGLIELTRYFTNTNIIRNIDIANYYEIISQINIFSYFDILKITEIIDNFK